MGNGQPSVERDLGRLAGSMEQLTNEVGRINASITEAFSIARQNGEHIVGLETKCTEIQSQIAEIKKTVILGNGQKSMVTQLSELSVQVATAQKNININKKELKEHTDNHDKLAEGRLLSKTQFYVGVLGLVGTMLLAGSALLAALL